MTRDVDVIQIIQTGLQIEFVPVEVAFRRPVSVLRLGVVGILIYAGRVADGTRLYVSITWSISAFTVSAVPFAEPWGEVALGKANIPRITVEFAAVHQADRRRQPWPCCARMCRQWWCFRSGDAQLRHLAVAFEVEECGCRRRLCNRRLRYGRYWYGRSRICRRIRLPTSPSRRSLLPAVRVALML